MAEIKDNALRDFCRWYIDYFGQREADASVFVTSLCGHFHSYPRAMKEIVMRMADIGIIKKEKDNITII